MENEFFCFVLKFYTNGQLSEKKTIHTIHSVNSLFKLNLSGYRRHRYFLSSLKQGNCQGHNKVMLTSSAQTGNYNGLRTVLQEPGYKYFYILYIFSMKNFKVQLVI